MQEKAPTGAPDPELALAARIQGQIVGLGAVPLEKAGQRLSGVHHFQKARIVNQLFEPVRGRGRGVCQLIFHALELEHEALVGLAAEAAQRCSLVQTDRREAVRVNIAIANPLVVGQDDGGRAGLHLGHGLAVGRFFHAQQIDRICPELRHYVQRHHNECLASLVLLKDSAPFQLHDRLAQTEAGKDAAPTAAQRPQDAHALVIFQHRVDLCGVNLNA